MRRVSVALISAVSVVAFTHMASAADLYQPIYKTAPPPPVPVYSWTGWYVGGNVGYSWGDARTDIAGSATTFSAIALAPGFANPPVSFANSATQRLQGIIGGGQIGYNYQFTPLWVLGFEADFQASGERGSTTFNDPLSGTLCFSVLSPPVRCNPGNPGPSGTVPLNGTAVTSFEAKIESFGTVRERLGVLVNDGLLLYATGGLAYGRVSVSGNVNMNATAPTFVPPASFDGTSPFNQSKTNVGFTVGGGLEGRLSNLLPPNWTVKMEYLYVDLGSLDNSTSIAAAPNAANSTFLSPLAGTLTTHTHFTDNIVRVGLNYQFH